MKNATKLVLMATTAMMLTAYDSGAQTTWKLDDKGAIVLKDGNPIFLDLDGKEKTVGIDTIHNLNTEAKGHRIAKEKAEERLKFYDGIDPELARKAIEIAGKVDAKKLIDAGEVDKVRDQIKGEYTKLLGEKDTAITGLQSRVDNMIVDGVFNNSQFVREQVAVPSDMFQASFRGNFKVVDGKVEAYGKDGNRLMSKSRHGEYADPEEALQLLVEMHPQKDVIRKAAPATGSGSGGGGGTRGGGRTMKMADFNQQTPAAKAEIAKKVGLGEMVLTD